MKYYLAGPMSNIPQFNYPLFIAATADLRANVGLEIYTPVEMDTIEMQERALASPDGDLATLEKDTGETWGDVLAKDVKLITDTIDGGVIVLPNWWKSKGARLEVFVAMTKGLPVLSYLGDEPLVKLTYTYIMEKINEGIL